MLAGFTLDKTAELARTIGCLLTVAYQIDTLGTSGPRSSSLYACIAVCWGIRSQEKTLLRGSDGNTDRREEKKCAAVFASGSRRLASSFQRSRVRPGLKKFYDLQRIAARLGIIGWMAGWLSLTAWTNSAPAQCVRFFFLRLNVWVWLSYSVPNVAITTSISCTPLQFLFSIFSVGNGLFIECWMHVCICFAPQWWSDPFRTSMEALG